MPIILCHLTLTISPSHPFSAFCFIMSDNYVDNEQDHKSPSRDFEYIKQCLAATSQNLVTAEAATNEGIFVEASQDMAEQSIMTCPAAAIALAPDLRLTHCGFCAVEILQSDSKNASCSCCHVVAACASCRSSLTDGHHLKECRVMSTLNTTFGSSKIDSIHLLVVRLLCQYYYCNQEDDDDHHQEVWKLFSVPLCQHCGNNTVE